MSFIQKIKERFIQSDLAIIGFGAIGFSISFSISIIRLGIVAFLITTLITLFKRSSNFNQLNEINLSRFLLPSYFVICSISLLHLTPNFAWLERAWMLFVFPLIFVFLDKKLNFYFISFLKGLILGTLLAGFLNFLIATKRSIKIIDGSIVFDSSAWGGVPFLFSIDHYGNFYFSNYFSFFMHPSYAALVITLGLAAVFTINPFNWSWKGIGLVVLLQLFFIGLLSSRAGIIGVLATMITIFIYKRNSIPIHVRYSVVVIFIISSVALFYHPRVKGLLSSGGNVSTRLISWQCALEEIKQNWLLGVGQDRVQQKLNERYALHGYEEHLLSEYNVHNQFLETWLGVGILGIILLILIFLTGFKNAIQYKNYFGVVVMINLLIHLSVESMLNRFQGIITVALFVPFIFCAINNKAN
jgi:O-antigen ligase